MLLKNAQLARVAETRRRSAEAAEGRHRLLFDRNLAGVLWTRRDGRIVDCNESLARLLGYDSRDRKSTRLNSSHSQISYAVFCLKKKKDMTSHPVLPTTLD